MSLTKIKNWDGKEYTLDELRQFCLEAHEGEVEFSCQIDGDLATTPTIINGLISRIKELEAK